MGVEDAVPVLPPGYDLADQLRDGLWRADTAQLATLHAERVVLAGDADALAAARVAVSACEPGVAGRVAIDTEDHALETIGSGDLVLALSYDGDDGPATEAVHAAHGSGARSVAVTTGGSLASAARSAGFPVIPLPAGFTSAEVRGYWVSVVLEVLRAAGLPVIPRAEVDAAADALERVDARWQAEGDGSEPARASASLRDARCVVLAAEASSAAVSQFATQLLSTAGLPAAVVDPGALRAIGASRLAAIAERSAARLLVFEASDWAPAGPTHELRAGLGTDLASGLELSMLGDAVSFLLAR